MRCQICGTELNGCLCPRCGCDQSQNREQYPTLADDGKQPEALWVLRNRRFDEPANRTPPAPAPGAKTEPEPATRFAPAPKPAPASQDAEPASALAPKKKVGWLLPVLLAVAAAVVVVIWNPWGSGKYQTGELEGKYVSVLDSNGNYVRADDEEIYNAIFERFIECMEVADSASSNDERFVLYAQAEAELLDTAVINPYKSNGSTTYFCALNIDRGAFEIPSGTVSSSKSERQKADTSTALNNKNFRKAIQYAFDKESYLNTYVSGDMTESVLRNMYTPPDFVKLANDTSDANGHIFPAGTYYGEMVQYYVDQLACKITAKDGIDGWYDPAAAKEYLKSAKAELGDSVSWPIYLDVVCYSGSDTSVAREYAFKVAIENALGVENVQVVLVEAADNSEYLESCIFVNGAGVDANYDVCLNFGWSPDYDNPGTYLNSLYIIADGSMLKYVGLY